MRRLLSWLGGALGSIALLIGIRKSVTLDNLRQAFPHASDSWLNATLRSSYQNLGRLYTEMIYLRFASRQSIQALVKLENPEMVISKFRDGAGVIFLGGHLGNWEWVVMGMSLILGHELDLVVKNQTGKFAERFIQQLRGRFGNRNVNAGDALKMYRILKSGGALVLLGDQAAPPDSQKVEFFGREVPTFEGAARLALHTRAALILFSCSREQNGGYRVRFDEIEYRDLTASTDTEVRTLTKRHVGALENAITSAPGLYLWQHRRWKHA